MMLADSIIDWGALLDVIWISAVAGLAIAAVLGVGIVSSLRAQDTEGGAALGLNAVTVISVVLVGAALITGIYFIADK
jgi:predicted benzoate:H+ symporter BenE